MSITRISNLPAAPQRPIHGHKGTFGRVLLIGGSRGMTGAICLAGLGSLRGGAGLVSLAIPNEIATVVSMVEPSYLTIPVEQDRATGQFSTTSVAALRQAVEGKDAVAIGPGIGTTADVSSLVAQFYADLSVPLVIDADGLNVLSEDPNRFAQHAGPRITTPHPGEFARMTGVEISQIQQDREGLAAEFARNNDVVVLLKGHHTVITDGLRLAVNSTGNSGMATGGSGDVLTGLVAALLAQGMPTFEAAQLGAHLHGLAGDLAAAELSQPGLIASDLPKFLAKAWRHLEEQGVDPTQIK